MLHTWMSLASLVFIEVTGNESLWIVKIITLHFPQTNKDQKPLSSILESFMYTFPITRHEKRVKTKVGIPSIRLNAFLWTSQETIVPAQERSRERKRMSRKSSSSYIQPPSLLNNDVETQINIRKSPNNALPVLYKLVLYKLVLYKLIYLSLLHIKLHLQTQWL